MNRTLSWFNFIGVLLLAALCATQWNVNRRVNRKAIDLEHQRIAQSAKIDEQDRTIKGNLADLDELRQRLTLNETALTESLARLNTTRAERDQLHLERDALKASLEKWTAAVAERDAAIKEASTRIEALVTERDDLVKKFNELAVKYNKSTVR